MEKSLSLGLISAAVVLSLFSSMAPALAEEQSKVSTPAKQLSPQDAAAVKKVNELLLRAISEREKPRNVQTYNGMAPWFGNDAISQAFDKTGAFLNRACVELYLDLAPQPHLKG